MGDNHAGPSSVLPPGWTAHVSPAGRTYYHKSSTGRSTYDFPKPPKQKREKPVAKTSIPGVEGWFRVTTNKGNEFFFHPESRTSEWLPPKEVAEALRAMQEKQREDEARAEREAEERERERHQRETLRREKRERKRKLEEGVPITEFDASAKRPRADGDEDEEDDDDDGDSIASEEPKAEYQQTLADIRTDDQSQSPSAGQPQPEQEDEQDDDEDEDEEWQRQIAEQMAAEAEAEDEAAASPSPPSPTQQPSQTAPTTSLDDQKAAFMALLTSLNSTRDEINPMAPWDLELAKFSSHPSYLAFSSSRDAEDVFNEWCKLRIREKRAAKASAATPTSTSSSKPTSTSQRAQADFQQLLKNEVRSTRTKYADFKAAFRDDARFRGLGKGDAERERLFRAHLVELGEEKRKAADKAEREFLVLLSDKLPGNYRNKVAAAKASASASGGEPDKEAVMSVWLEAKRTPGVVEDARYDAVGSSTRRFELFCSWAKGERKPTPHSHSNSTSSQQPPRLEEDDKARRAREKSEEKRKAFREREDKVRRERERIARLNRTALSAATRSESRLGFQQLLLDALVSPHISYHSALPSLAKDPRFDAPGLSDHDKEQLFQEHRQRLSARQAGKIAQVFAKYAPTLDADREDVIALTMEDDELSHGALKVYRDDVVELERAYKRWDEERHEKAKKAFFEMLRESAFVEFWGRLKKEAQSASGEKDGNREGQEEGQEGENVMLVDLARKVDLQEIESVLHNDARFRAFRHTPELRQRWIREHLHHLAAPSKSVHK